LRFGTIEEAAKLLDVEAKLDRRNPVQILLRDERQPLFDVGHPCLKHLFDFSSFRVRKERRLQRR